MWEKVKAFFNKKVTKIVAWVVLFLDIVVLVIGNVTKAELTNAVELAFVGIGAIVAIVAFITESIKN